MRTVNRIGLCTVALLAVLAGAAPATAGQGRVHVVTEGGSIQAALDQARPGDTVLVKQGVYVENLEITTDGVTLIGQGAVLEAPQVSTPRHCSSDLGLPTNPFGLCVTGTLTPGRPPTVVRPVRDVTVRGMIVHRFPSTGIVVLGGDRVTIDNVEAIGGTAYGILLSRSSNVTVANSRVSGGNNSALYIGDSPDSHDVVRNNVLSDSPQFGLYLRNTTSGTVVGNTITNNCVGVSLFPTVNEPDAVSDWFIALNRISGNQKLCPLLEEGGPEVGGVGVLMAGTRRITLSANLITGNRPPAGISPDWSGGVVMASATIFGGPPVPAGNRVVGNLFGDNEAFDLNVIDAGEDNRFLANRCEASSPAGLC
jgi:parallel beta-helix repeat protein